ncbi:MAG: UDP-2,3-diacylglucosamine diphosphatase [Bacteroidia bacterium]
MTDEPKKRKVEIVVLSDIHLGTYGCHAKELVQYLKSIKPKILVLNGDIIDVWQFSKSYWPKSHMQVVKYFTSCIGRKTQVYYIPGNHDEMLRRFVGFKMPNFQIVNKVVLEIDGKKAWMFHGDVFDVTMKHSRWLAKLGAKGYDSLILINRAVNFISEKLGRGKISLSKKVKNSVKSAVKFINDFEDVCAGIAIDNKYDYVVCGHIHQPEMKTISNQKGEVVYLNSGDWIENLTALEYNEGEWRIYNYMEDKINHEQPIYEEPEKYLDNSELFKNLLQEFSFPKS